MAGHKEGNPQLRTAIAASHLTYDALARAVRGVAAENGELLRTNKSAIVADLGSTDTQWPRPRSPLPACPCRWTTITSRSPG